MSLTSIDRRLNDLSAERLRLLWRWLHEGEDLSTQTEITKREQRDHIPLSFAQERLWFVDQLIKGAPVYNLTLAMPFGANPCIENLQSALDSLIARHEALRTCFVLNGAQPVQHIKDELKVEIEDVDASREMDCDPSLAVQKILSDRVNQPFDLNDGPLIRATLIRDRDHAVLALTMHHIVSDGWSLNIAQREIQDHYDQLSRGITPSMQPLAIQYADYAIWQRKAFSGAALDEAKNYWRQRLESIPALSSLPCDFPRPQIETHKGATLSCALPTDLPQRISNAANQYGVTDFMFTMAVFQTLIVRWRGEADSIIGTPVAGRGRSETEPLIGFFVNMLTLRNIIDSSQTLNELFGDIKQTTLDAYRYDQMPFEALVEELSPERSLSYHPLFQLAFVFDTLQEHSDTRRMTPSNSAEQHFEYLETTSKFDLTLSVTKTASQWRLQCEYSTDLYRRETIETFVHQYIRLLDAFSSQYSGAIGDIPLHNDADEAQFKSLLNRRSTPPLRKWTDLVEANAQTQPDQPAVHQATYGELWERVRALEKQLTVTDRVLVTAADTASQLISAMAVLRAGAHATFVDASSEVERDGDFNAMIDDNCNISKNDRKPLHSHSSSVNTDEGIVRLQTASGWSDYRDLDLTAMTDAWREILCLSREDQVTQDVGDGFAPAAAALAAGAAWTTDTGTDANHPSRTLITSPEKLSKKSPDRSDGLKLVCMVAPHIWPHSWCNWAEKTQIVQAVATKGVFAPVAYEILNGVKDGMRPALNAVVRICDQSNQFCPPHIPGALQLASYNGAASNGSAKTWKSTETFATMVETGALTFHTRLNTDLEITSYLREYFEQHPLVKACEIAIDKETNQHRVAFTPYTDRKIDITQLRNEAHENLHPNARIKQLGAFDKLSGEDARVFLLGSDNDNEDIGAVQQGDMPTTPLEALLSRIWSEVLEHPHIGIHDNFFTLGGNSIASIKVLARINEAVGASIELHQIFEAPTIAQLALIAEQQNATTSPVSQHDAAQALLRFGLNLEQMTDAELINFIDEMEPHALNLLLTEVTPDREGDEQPLEQDDTAMKRRRCRNLLLAEKRLRTHLPLSYSQERLWFMSQLSPNSAAYNLPTLIPFATDVDEAYLTTSLTHLTQRHESLRTLFSFEDGAPCRKILSTYEPVIDVRDFRSDHAVDAQAKATYAINLDIAKPFQLDREPPIRCTLIKMSNSSSLLLVNIHHIITDGWSSDILQRELTYLYNAVANGLDSDLPELSSSYSDYVAWQKGSENQLHQKANIQYFKEQLEAMPPLLEFPTDARRPWAENNAGGTVQFTMAAPSRGFVEAFAQDRQSTPFIILLTVFYLLIHKHTGRNELVVGSPMAGRNRIDDEGLIGFYVNMLVLKSDISDHMTFNDAVTHVKDTVSAAFRHQNAPFEKLVEAVKAERNLAWNPIFQIAFAVQEQIDTPTPDSSDAISFDDSYVEGTSKFDFTLQFTPAGDTYVGGCEFKTDLYGKETVRRLLERYQRLAAELLANPDARLCDLTVLTDTERLSTEAKLKTTIQSIETNTSSWSDMVMHQARLNPDAAALQLTDGIVTYAELASDALGEMKRRKNDRVITIDPACDIRRMLTLVLAGLLNKANVVFPQKGPLPDGNDMAPATINAEGGVFAEIDGGRCALTDQTLSRIAQAAQRQFSFSSHDIVGFSLNGALDHPTYDMLAVAVAVLSNGGCITPLSTDETSGIAATVTKALVSPRYLNTIQHDQFPALKTLIIQSANVWPFALADLPDNLHITQLWGPPETLGWLMTAARDELQHFSLLPGLSAALFDANNRLAPSGVNGRLCVSDPFTSAISPHSFKYLEQSWAQTSYFGRYDNDGNITFIQNNDDDDQREIVLDVLRQHPAIADAAVEVNGTDHQRIHTVYVSPLQGRNIREHDILEFLRKMLGAYPSIRTVHCVREITRLTNGALDTAALTQSSPQILEETPPRTPLEAIVLRIWKQVLDKDRLSIHDNFFEIGGNSLTSVMVVNRIRESVSVDLELHLLFEAPTVAALAELLQSQLNGETSEVHADHDNSGSENTEISTVLGPTPISPQQRNGTIQGPLSMAQERLWFLEQLDLNKGLYNMPLLMPLERAYSDQDVENALNNLLERHEVLRSRIVSVAGIPQQIASPSAYVSLEILDFSELSHPELQAKINDLTTSAAQARFDLSTGVMLRPTLIRASHAPDYLLLNTHHIVCDGWSVPILNKELNLLLAINAGEQDASALPDISDVQYIDFARWQRRNAHTKYMRRHLDYWRDQLSDAPTVLELPYDRQRPAVESHRGALQTFCIDEQLSQKVIDIATTQETTPFVILLTAFNCLLAKLSGQTDIVVGAPIANRTRMEIEPLIGLFANTLILRTDLSGEPTFTQAVARTHRISHEAQQHQDVPFEQLVDVLKPQRNLSHNPLFQVMMVMQNQPITDKRNQRQDRSAYPNAHGQVIKYQSKFDLTLTIGQLDRVFDATLEYATDLFDDETITRWIDHFITFLRSALSNPNRNISELPLYSDEDRNHIITDYNSKRDDYGQSLNLVELIEHHALKTPDAIAIIGDGCTMSYRDFIASADRFTRHLLDAGAKPGTAVALSSPRSIEALVAVVAIIKTGATYVPIDPSYPEERRAFILDDCCASIVVAPPELSIPASEKHRRLWLTDVTEPKPSTSTSPIEVSVDQTFPLYVIYTSGSTGHPKGVEMPHSVLEHLVNWQIHRFDRHNSMRILQFSSMSFDVSLQEMFTAWCSGGSLVLADDATRSDPSALIDHLRKHKVETLFLPYVALQALCEEHQRLDAAAMPSLRDVVTAGEQLRITPAIRRFFKHHRNAKLLNQYGPSETHIVSEYALSDDPDAWGDLPPIGVPVANARLYVLDPSLNPTPIGVVGEIFIGGDAVANGYLHRPSATAEKFVPDPYAPQPFARMYRSGDFGRLTTSGAIEYVGRRDAQIKWRGYRIEMGEIEACLNNHPQVTESVVLLREDTPGAPMLAAYISADSTIDPTLLRVFLKSRLPSYMAPTSFTQLENLPRTASGKLDRRALPAPTAQNPQEPDNGDFGRDPSELEKALASQWSRLLGRSSISITDDFFELGGHSLLAARICAEAERTSGVPVTVRALFDHPTVESFARHIIERFTSAINENGGEPLLTRLEAES